MQKLQRGFCKPTACMPSMVQAPSAIGILKLLGSISSMVPGQLLTQTLLHTDRRSG